MEQINDPYYYGPNPKIRSLINAERYKPLVDLSRYAKLFSVVKMLFSLAKTPNSEFRVINIIPNTAVFGPTKLIGTIASITTTTTARMKISG